MRIALQLTGIHTTQGDTLEQQSTLNEYSNTASQSCPQLTSHWFFNLDKCLMCSLGQLFSMFKYTMEIACTILTHLLLFFHLFTNHLYER